MTNFDFNSVKDAGWDFLKGLDRSASIWAILFDTIVGLPSGTKGIFGEFLIERCCSEAGLDVSPCPAIDRGSYDRLIDDFRVEVKTSFEGSDGNWIFQQIRYPDNYDYLCCLGISPDDVKCFVLHSREIEYLIETGDFSHQHAGKRTWWYNVSVGVNPDWYLGEGTLNEAIEIFVKCSTGGYMSHWGQIQELESNN